MPKLDPTRRNKDGTLKPGATGNPAGRPRGARAKLGEEFLQALQADFHEHGAAAIAQVRAERPQDYLKVIAQILPKQIELSQPVEELADDEIEQELVKAVAHDPALYARMMSALKAAAH